MSVDGRVTLEERLQTGALAVDEAVRIVWSLCDWFEKNGKSKTLGDVSPQRVTLSGRGVEAHIPDANPLPIYSAPERMSSRPTPRSDVYSMGALLTHLILGHPPDGSGLPERASHLQGVVDKCLAPDSTARFESLSDLKRALVRLDQTLISGSRSGAHRLAAELKLDPWAIEGLHGQGSMGTVYKVRHQALGRLAAIKVLRREQYQQPELVQRFFQEARTVNQINHEHIVEISDFVQVPGESGPSAVYCVMEFLQGRTLGELLEQGPISIERGVKIVEQLCDALAAAHRVGVVHRDIKPDNIMLIERGGTKDYVKVLDFGVAKLTDTDGKAMVATTEGAIIGTPICMSPEQAQGSAVDGRSDVWAVGVILYRLLSGRFPFDAPTFVNIAVQIITKPYAPLPAKTTLGEPIPPRLVALVEACLQKDRERRLKSMDELRDELRAIARGEPTPNERGARGSPVKWLLGGLGVVGLLALAGLGWRAQQKQDQPPAPVAVVAPPPVTVMAPAPVPVEEDAGDSEDSGAEANLDAGTPPEDAGSRDYDAGVVKRVAPPLKPIRLSAESIGAHMQTLMPRFLGCASANRDEAMAVAAGTRLAFKLERSGKVLNARIDGPGGGGDFERCIQKALSKAGFPRIEGPLPDKDIKVPLILK